MFTSDIQKIISEDLMKSLQSKIPEIEAIANRELQTAIRKLKVYDTGNLANHSQARINMSSKSIAIRFSTVGVDYAPSPYYGLGTSRKYGPRNYLKLGAIMTVRSLGISSKGMNTVDTLTQYTGGTRASGFTKIGTTKSGKDKYTRTRNLK